MVQLHFGHVFDYDDLIQNVTAGGGCGAFLFFSVFNQTSPILDQYLIFPITSFVSFLQVLLFRLYCYNIVV